MSGHTSEQRWQQNDLGDPGISELIRGGARDVLSHLQAGEELYQDLIEVFQFAGGTDQLLADQLFLEDWTGRTAPGSSPPAPETEANAAEVAKVADAKAAMLAIHELYQALTNGAVLTADRRALLRRMS